MSNFYQIRWDYPRFYAYIGPRVRGALRGIAIFKHYWYGQRVDRYWKSKQPRTGKQQGWRSYFYDAVKNWRSFDIATKSVYNKDAIPAKITGITRYIQLFLKAQNKMIIYWGPLSKSASDSASPDAYMSSDRFQGVQKLLTRTDYPAGFPYGALFYHDTLDMMLGRVKTGWKQFGKPDAHASTHQNGGSDQISVAGLSGVLSDNQPSSWSQVASKPSTFAPSGHHTSHEHGGGDDINLGALVGSTVAICLDLDGAGYVLTPGVKADVYIPFGLTISAWHIFGDVAGSAVVDVWSAAEGSFPPVVGNTITSDQKPTLSSQQNASLTNLSHWTASVASGNVLRFNLDSVQLIKRLHLELVCVKA